MTEETEEKFDIRHTFLIGIAFFVVELAWNTYDSQVNISLFAYLGSVALVGLVMGLDNAVGVVVQPIMGNVSDNTRTKWGRRMPYIIIGIPCAAFFFVLISFETSLFSLLFFMFCFMFSMAFFRSQAVALMPEFVKPEHRSKANSIINMMSGISLVVAALISLLIVDISLQFAFITVGIIMIVALIVLVLTVKETESYGWLLLMEMEEVKLVEAGSSDWVVFPHGGYTQDERAFLLFMISIIGAALEKDGSIESKGLMEWVRTRKMQIENGEMALIAHQLDVVGKYYG